ncbi:MAG: dihydroorotate dehydrogenase, partial [Armatimonadetes bacterium]|nr:dihydroorotate dehydrogenase [Armatimonadota bacterium]
QEAGADALALINTIAGLAIDVERRRPKLGGVTGGLSGPAIRPVAVRMGWEVARACTIPVIGMGGITGADDALEFFIAGARAVGVGSAVIDTPNVASQLCEGLTSYLVRHGFSSITDVVGTLEISS